ncbi:hypothetical protein RHGRI_024448 [Rhododendron griersonianum]|uniref:Cytochrome P450 n=1 Tax=Rhododendron griersonianum TaxID=479676 RepID=A0AAV6J9Q2_9ERIC|nr:hypothetical protein RHGRI_024448 [Rhododendron griersonianum]
MIPVPTLHGPHQGGSDVAHSRIPPTPTSSPPPTDDRSTRQSTPPLADDRPTPTVVPLIGGGLTEERIMKTYAQAVLWLVLAFMAQGSRGFTVPADVVFLLKKWVLIGNPSSTTKNFPPSPPKLPFIGNLHQLGLSAHRSLQSLSRKHGPLMLLQLGSVPALVVSSADAAKEIIKVHDLALSNRPKLRAAKRLLYDYKDVSMAPYGELWRQLKSIYVLQLLSNKRVQYFRRVREEETALMVEKIRESGSESMPTNLSEMFMDLTNDVVCRVVLGKKYGEGESGNEFKMLLRDFVTLMGSLDIGDFVPWLGWVNWVTGVDAKIDRVAKWFDEFLEGLVEERLKLNNDGGDDSEGNKNFFDILLQIHKYNSAGISIDRDCIKAQILIAFAAGTDTTSTFLEWAMSELLRNPRVMIKVQDEVREILSLTGKAEIAEDDLEHMQYLKAVIKEALRLHPSVPLLVPHEAREDIRVMGYDITAGTMVITNAWAIGRDPSTWDEPDEFRPERFLNCPIDFRGHDFQLIPFGAGRRGCPGISFATVIGELVFANLLHKFNWSMPGGAKAEDLDMTECTGAIAHREFPLLAIATPC